MIKYVAKAIPTYFMSTFDAPSKVCDNLDVLTKKFWWNSKNSNDKYLACTKLCYLKSRGPLVLKRANNLRREMLQPQIILQYFYKLLLWQTLTSPHLSLLLTSIFHLPIIFHRINNL